MKDINGGLFFAILITIILAFVVGRWSAKQEYRIETYKIEKLQVSLDNCENMWKSQKELFYPELCKTVCEEEFEKMGC